MHGGHEPLRRGRRGGGGPVSKRRIPSRVFTILVYLFLYAPIALLIIFSFSVLKKTLYRITSVKGVISTRYHLCLSLTAAGICRKHYPLTGISRENLPGFLQPAKTSAAARTLFSSPVPKLPSLYPTNSLRNKNSHTFF